MFLQSKKQSRTKQRRISGLEKARNYLVNTSYFPTGETEIRKFLRLSWDLIVKVVPKPRVKPKLWGVLCPLKTVNGWNHPRRAQGSGTAWASCCVRSSKIRDWAQRAGPLAMTLPFGQLCFTKTWSPTSLACHPGFLVHSPSSNHKFRLPANTALRTRVHCQNSLNSHMASVNANNALTVEGRQTGLGQKAPHSGPRKKRGNQEPHPTFWSGWSE